VPELGEDGKYYDVVRRYRDTLPQEQGEPEVITDEMKSDLESQLVATGFPLVLARQMVGLCYETEKGWAFCPKCHCKVQADFVSAKPRLEAIKLAMNYLRGKPVDRQEIVVAATSVSELAGLDRKELERIASGG
jgi:hypothetical protein